METSVLLHKFKALPEEGKKELFDFIEYLTFRYLKRSQKKKQNLRFDWEGSIEYKNQSSVELQHNINEWRGT